jgi:hypothetical protein
MYTKTFYANGEVVIKWLIQYWTCN